MDKSERLCRKRRAYSGLRTKNRQRVETEIVDERGGLYLCLYLIRSGLTFPIRQFLPFALRDNIGF